ncbi:MAG: branched-chain amino acid transport system permease protein [Oceanotoga sp.]|nr:branched-chain amino acid transport system permease protein [Oceanotoga sp.]
MWILFANVLINGTINGSIYALIALGFSLTFGVAGVVNLYHGAYYMVAAYLTYTFISLNFPSWLAAIISLLLVAGLGGLMMKGPILYLRKKGESIYILIFTLGAAYFTQYLFTMLYGARRYSIMPFYDNALNIMGETVPGSRVFAFIISIITIIAVMLFINKTSFGKQILATSQDVYAAELVGINTSSVFILTSAISALLAGIGGIVISPFLSISVDMWLPTLLKAFSIVILGGLGSIGGSIVAAFIMAYIEGIVAITWTSSMTEVVFLVLVFIFLIFKPTGIMGKKTI